MAATKKKKSTAKRRTKAAQKAYNQILAVFLFTLGALLVFLSFIEGAMGWKAIHDVMFGLFGWSAYLIGPLFIYISLVASFDKVSADLPFKALLTTLLLCLISSASQLYLAGMPEEANVVELIKTLYGSGIALKGGGVISVLFGAPLMLLGTPGDKIVVVLLIFALLMIITGSTLSGILRSAKKPVQKLSEGYQDLVAQREAQLAAKPPKETKRRFDIDIPLDPDPPKRPAKAAAAKPPVEADAPPEPEVLLQKKEFQGSRAKERLLSTLTEEAAVHPAPEPEAPAPAGEEDEKDVYIDDIIRRITPPSPVQKQVEAEPAPMPLEEATSAPSPEGQPAGPPMEPAGAKEPPKRPEPPEYAIPPLTLLREPKTPSGDEQTGDELKQNAQRLVDTLQSFGVQTRIIDISRGPAVTRYELQPSAGVKISKITSLADDIALNLAAAGVRIEAPIPNKAAVGIEIPNRTVSPVTLREVVDSPEFSDAKSKVTIALGKDISGSITVANIAKMPHLLIAGSTGSGKSVCINSIIMSILYKSKPDEVKLLMVDPKVVELGVYNGLPQLLVPVVNDPKKAAGVLGWAVAEMLNRYKTFAQHGVRDIISYNKFSEGQEELESMPHIVIIIDELSDLMMAAPSEVEDNICRLAQMARAAGMHLVIATQRPSVDVITGIIKANIPSRIAFAVSSQIDSRTILDMGGAEKLLGAGDMLFYPVGASKPLRVQGCFVSDDEIERVVSFIKSEVQTEYDQQIIDEIDKHTPAGKSGAGGSEGSDEDGDDMLPAAIECVIEAGQASTSLLQRKLKLGYARAARIVDELEVRGIVGPFEGSKPRQVLISRERWIEMKLMKDETGE